METFTDRLLQDLDELLDDAADDGGCDGCEATCTECPAAGRGAA